MPLRHGPTAALLLLAPLLASSLPLVVTLEYCPDNDRAHCTGPAGTWLHIIEATRAPDGANPALCKPKSG
jgi:hypothetical protein